MKIIIRDHILQIIIQLTIKVNFNGNFKIRQIKFKEINKIDKCINLNLLEKLKKIALFKNK